VGRLLVATPLIGDPNFERTVVLILAHDEDGAFGVVLNRPSDTLVDEIAPEWSPHVSSPGVVFVGGPVGRDAVIGLARSGDRMVSHVHDQLGDLGTIDLNDAPPEGDRPCAALRLFAGGAGWTSRQLDDELREGAWWVVDAHVDDILTQDPAHLWATVLRRQTGEMAWYANHPEDPSAT
jgi:putative transcriptional regulator